MSWTILLATSVEGRCQMTKRRDEKLTPELREILAKARSRFITKFGREPGPGDPVFFDPDRDVPTPLDADQVRADLCTDGIPSCCSNTMWSPGSRRRPLPGSWASVAESSITGSRPASSIAR